MTTLLGELGARNDEMSSSSCFASQRTESLSSLLEYSTITYMGNRQVCVLESGNFETAVYFRVRRYHCGKEQVTTRIATMGEILETRRAFRREYVPKLKENLSLLKEYIEEVSTPGVRLFDLVGGIGEIYRSTHLWLAGFRAVENYRKRESNCGMARPSKSLFKGIVKSRVKV